MKSLIENIQPDTPWYNFDLIAGREKMEKRRDRKRKISFYPVITVSFLIIFLLILVFIFPFAITKVKHDLFVHIIMILITFLSIFAFIVIPIINPLFPKEIKEIKTDEDAYRFFEIKLNKLNRKLSVNLSPLYTVFTMEKLVLSKAVGFAASISVLQQDELDKVTVLIKEETRLRRELKELEELAGLFVDTRGYESYFDLKQWSS